MRSHPRRPDHHFLNFAYNMNLLKNSIEPYTCLLYLLLLTAHISIVWLLPYFPTQDGPSHIYNLAILKDLLNGGQVWGDYYYSQLRPIPNLGFHIFAYPLLAAFSPQTTERLFITIYLILMALSVPFFMRSFNKPPFPISFFVFPVMFNFNLMMGFYSYAIAVPVFLMAFGYCYQIRKSSLLKRFIIYNILGLIIFYLHLVAFGLFILSLFCLVISESDRFKDIPLKLLNLTFIISPALINLVVYLQNSSKDYDAVPIRYITLADRINDLITFSSATLSHWQLGSGCLLFYIFIRFLTYGVFSAATISKNRIYLKLINDETKCLMLLSFALVLICLFFPFMWGNGSFFNQRFPWVILLVMLPVIHIRAELIPRKLSSSILIFISILVLMVNATIMRQKSTDIEAFLKGLSVNFPKGAYVMTCKPYSDYFRIDVLMHASAYYGLTKKVIVIGNYEASTKLFPVRFKSSLPAFPTIDQAVYEAKSINWALFPAISYLFVWQADDESNRKLAPYYRQTYKNGNIAVWQRI